MSADPQASQPHFQNRFFDPKRDHFAQAQLHLKCSILVASTLRLPRDSPASTLHRRDLSRNGVSLTPFYLLSARLDQDDVAYAEAKLPQTTNILPAGPVDREFLFLFFLMIRRPPRSTRKESSAASDVYKRQLLLLLLLLTSCRRGRVIGSLYI